MSLQQIKRKITSIKSTAKITNAMSLIATTKLKKQRKIYENNKEYSKDFFRIIGFLLESLKDDAGLEVKNAQPRTLWIQINSTMGLCGSYNAQINNQMMHEVKDGDYVFQFGKQGLKIWNYQNKIASPIQPIEALAIGTSFSFPHSHSVNRPFTTYVVQNKKQNDGRSRLELSKY